LQDKASKGFDKASTHAERMSKKMSSVGKKLSIGVTAPIVALGAASVKAASDFESAFAGVIKTVDASDAELAKLRQTIRDMATDASNPLAGLENAHETLAGIMELGGQLGVPVASLKEFTQVIGELGLATNLTTEEAATMLAQFANITNMPFSDLDRLGSTIVDLGNNMATTERDIVQFGQRLAGIGSTVGMSEDQILALGAAMASMGIRAEAGGTAMTQTLTKMISAVGKGGAELDKFAKVAGVSSKQFAAAWNQDAAGALQMFLEGLSKLDQAAQTRALEALGLDGVRVADAMRRLSGNTELVAKAFNIANGAWQENNALSKEAQQRLQTTQAQWNVFKNTINDLAISFGNILLPAVNDILKFVQPLVRAFANLPEPVKKVIVIVGLLAAAIGPVMLIVSGLIGAFGALQAGVLALAAALGVIGAPILLTVAAGVALGFAIKKLIDHFGGVKNIIGSVVGKLKDLWGAFTGGAKQAMEGFKTLVQYLQQEGLKGLVNIFKSIIEGIVKGLVDFVKKAFDKITNEVKKGINKIENFLGISSPSKVMMKIGRQMGEGMNLGFEKSGGLAGIAKSVNKFTPPGLNVGSAAPSMATSGGKISGQSGGGNVNIQNLNVPPGTTQEQVDILMREFGKRIKLRGGFGLR